ncbi:MAG: hypothetical protein NW208_09610 [Bryobacter sp.]|nr:hypothetical protein [Bryobacter sp.]
MRIAMKNKCQVNYRQNALMSVVVTLMSALCWMVHPASGATFGSRVVISGQTADLALDERRGVVYVANFTANRIEVVSMQSASIVTSFNVAPQPGSLSVSPDGRYLVIAHYGNSAEGITPRNAITIVDLDQNQRQTLSISSVPLSVAFGVDGKALVVTSNAFLLLDPATRVLTTLSTIQQVATKTLPVPFNNFPQNVVASSSQASKDLSRIFGVVQGGENDSEVLVFRYDVGRSLIFGGRVSSPPLGPRTISVDAAGRNVLIGWALLNENFVNVAQFPGPTGILNIGGHSFDSGRGVIYAQLSTSTQGANNQPGVGDPASEKELQVLDAENLAVRERLRIPENLSGKAVLTSDGATLFASSESGLLILPVGSLASQPRVVSSALDVDFQGNFCDRRIVTHEIVLSDPSGKETDFAIRNVSQGITVEPLSGFTPAVVRVTVDPFVFSGSLGTTVRELTIESNGSVFANQSLRVLINSKNPDQRGTRIVVPGRLVDVLADPTQNRFFVLRQSTNEVLVFDGGTYQQIAVVKTGNTPTQMAISFDKQWLLVGNDNSQIINVISLATLRPSAPIQMPGGHYPRSVASGAGATFAASRVAGPEHKVSLVNIPARSAFSLPTLDVFENNININTILVASPNGAKIFGASADGTTFLYDGNANSFVASRKDFPALQGAFGVSSNDQFFIGNTILNGSLVPTQQLGDSASVVPGFAFIDNQGLRFTAEGSSGPGFLQRVQANGQLSAIGTRTVEAPLLSDANVPFVRTLAPLANRSAIVSLTTSGFTVLPWQFDAATISPRVDRVVNLADGSTSIAPGSLVRIEGTALSPITQTTAERPLPTALGESCITINGLPIPLIFVSSQEVNAQIPFEFDGAATLILRTPGGTSDNFPLQIVPNAPGVFVANFPEAGVSLPTVVNARNGLLASGSNPIKRGDSIVVYLTGLGRTFPEVDTGLAAPSDPLAQAVVKPVLFLGGRELPVDFAGLTPGEVGVYQINAQIPHDVPVGFSIPLEIQQGGRTITLNARVIN